MATFSVEVLTPERLTSADALAMSELALLVWPSKTGDTPAQHAAAIIAQRDSGHYATCDKLWYLVRQPSPDPATPGKILAKAEGFIRTIGTTRGPITILALAGVCTNPTARGQGLGSMVVESALTRVNARQLPFGFWQTTPNRIAFYQRLGGCPATNPVINTLAENPQANPFWDPITIRYPKDAGDRPWPEGVIDLRGEGY